MDNGALIAVPIPEEYEEAGRLIQLAVDEAVAESKEKGIDKSGKDATPWLLQRIGELTKGSSLTSNIALLKNTALVGKQSLNFKVLISNSTASSGGEIAVEYQKLSNQVRDASHPHL